MGTIDASCDKKGEILSVVCDNLLGSVRKRPDVKKLLAIRGFPLNVEVVLGESVSETKKLIAEAKKAGEKLEEKVVAEFEKFLAALVDLQEQEAKGDTKAADKADKLLKSTAKAFEKIAGGAGTEIRKAIEKPLKDVSSGKERASAVSRTVFRGFELRDGAFQGQVEDDDEIDPSIDGYLKALDKSSKTLADEGSEEMKARKQFVQVIEEAKRELGEDPQVAKNAKSLSDYVKDNPKLAKSLEDAKSEYEAQVELFAKSMFKLDKPLENLEKLAKKDDKLKESKAAVKAIEALRSARTDVDQHLMSLWTPARAADDLLKKNFDRGKGFDAVIHLCDKADDSAKLGKAVVVAVNDVEKALPE